MRSQVFITSAWCLTSQKCCEMLSHCAERAMFNKWLSRLLHKNKHVICTSMQVVLSEFFQFFKLCFQGLTMLKVQLVIATIKGQLGNISPLSMTMVLVVYILNSLPVPVAICNTSCQSESVLLAILFFIWLKETLYNRGTFINISRHINRH